MSEVHVSAKDKGPDIIALFDDENGLGVTIVECKAYHDDPGRALTDAATYFKEVDSNIHSVRIRQIVNMLADVLPDDKAEYVTPALWKQKCCYIPNPHYDADIQISWLSNRPSLRSLSPGPERVIIMPHAITGFSEFFDNVATEMISYAEGMVEHV